MSNTKSVVNSAIASVMAIGLGFAASDAIAAKAGFEKCAGVVKAGKNDCANNRHSCSGQSAKDGLSDEWLYVAEGTCKNIVGGKIFSKKK